MVMKIFVRVLAIVLFGNRVLLPAGLRKDIKIY